MISLPDKPRRRLLADQRESVMAYLREHHVASKAQIQAGCRMRESSLMYVLRERETFVKIKFATYTLAELLASGEVDRDQWLARLPKRVNGVPAGTTSEESFDQANGAPKRVSAETMAARVEVYLRVNGPTKYGIIGRDTNLRLDDLAEFLAGDARFRRSDVVEGAWELVA